MMRTLYLHVGVHRTGTTSSQKFFRDNFDVLLSKGCLYPFGVKRHDQYIRRMTNRDLSVRDFSLDLIKRADSHSVPIRSILISDEDMSMIQDFSLFAALKDHFDVKVVVSLRRQDVWLESWYQQNVKWQWNTSLSHLSFEEFFDRRAEFFWVDYAARLAHYEAVFGEGSVIAGVFERADMAQGPIAALLNMMGIEDLSGFGPFVHSNSSLKPLLSEYMRHLPLDVMDAKERIIFEMACRDVNIDLVTNGSKLVMTHPQRLIVQEEYAQSNAATAKRYIGRDILFNDPLPAASEPLAERNLSADAQFLMTQFVTPLVRSVGDMLAAARIAREIASAEAAGKPAPKPGAGKGTGGKGAAGKGQGKPAKKLRKVQAAV